MNEQVIIMNMESDQNWQLKKQTMDKNEDLEIVDIFDSLINTRLKCYISDVLGNDSYRKLMIDQMNSIRFFVEAESKDVIYFVFMK